MSFPTYNPDVDLQILKELSYEDIQKVCVTNEYMKKLCERDDLWLQKLKDDYPGLYDEVLGDFDPDVSYKNIRYAFRNFHRVVKVLCSQEYFDKINIEATEITSFTITKLLPDSLQVVNLFLASQNTQRIIEKWISYNLSTRKIVDNTPVDAPYSEIKPEEIIIRTF